MLYRFSWLFSFLLLTSCGSLPSEMKQTAEQKVLHEIEKKMTEQALRGMTHLIYELPAKSSVLLAEGKSGAEDFIVRWCHQEGYQVMVVKQQTTVQYIISWDL